MRQYQEELKVKQMKNADTPSLSVERMKEAQEKLQTPYLVLSGHVKPGYELVGLFPFRLKLYICINIYLKIHLHWLLIWCIICLQAD